MRQLRDRARAFLRWYRDKARRLFLGCAPEAEAIRYDRMEGMNRELQDLGRELRTLQAAVGVYRRESYIPRHHGGV